MKLLTLILQVTIPSCLFASDIDLAVFQVVTMSYGNYRNRAILSYRHGYPSITIELIQNPLDDGAKSKFVKGLDVSKLKGGAVLDKEGEIRDLKWEGYNTFSFVVPQNKKCKISDFNRKDIEVLCSKIK